jgi:hypothetical protein
MNLPAPRPIAVVIIASRTGELVNVNPAAPPDGPPPGGL